MTTSLAPSPPTQSPTNAADASPALPPRRRFGWLHRLSPQAVFVILALVFGTILVGLIPPMQAPDEPSHFWRAYDLSRGHLVSKNFGGLIPVSINLAVNDFIPVILQKTTTTPQAILTDLHKPLEPKKVFWKGFPSSALYSPVSYGPQTLGVLLGRKLHWSPLALMYCGRFANAWLYALLGYIAIRITPILKWAMVVILISPLPLFLSATLSADPTASGLVSIATALILRSIFSQRIASWGAVTAMAIAMGLAALCKSVYFPLTLFLVAVPFARWGTGRQRWIKPLVIVAVTTGCIMAWSAVSHPMQVREKPLDPYVQLHWIMHHPVGYLSRVYNTLSDESDSLIISVIGVLGWLDTPMGFNFTLVYIMFILWMVLNDDSPFTPSLKTRLLAFAAMALTSAGIITTIYMIWDNPGALVIEGIQGRYAIPLTLLTFTIIQRRGDSGLKPHWTMMILAASCCYELWVVLTRYYVL